MPLERSNSVISEIVPDSGTLVLTRVYDGSGSSIGYCFYNKKGRLRPNNRQIKHDEKTAVGRLEKAKSIALARQKTPVILGSGQGDRERLTR
jgi:hypothetical protein|tara:strand:+ start:2407 stop:2682 length:276 start_codon:yes stop_codon:yes gene_type:complete